MNTVRQNYMATLVIERTIPITGGSGGFDGD
jgi:hypothetical protein